jgi:hypothetical protein
MTFTIAVVHARLGAVDDRRLRVGSLVEWLVATLGVAAVIWLLSVPAQRLLGPGVEASLVEVPSGLPPGVPAGATSIPVMLLRDGREIRQGELQSRINTLLPEKLAAGSVQVSTGEFGARHTRAYLLEGIKFYVVCERLEAGAPMRVSGIYLP